MVSELCLMCGSTKNCQTLCLGVRPRYSLVVDEDVKKPNKHAASNYLCSPSLPVCLSVCLCFSPPICPLLFLSLFSPSLSVSVGLPLPLLSLSPHSPTSSLQYNLPVNDQLVEPASLTMLYYLNGIGVERV